LNSRIITGLLTVVGLCAAVGAAQAQTATDRVYLIDARNEVARSGFGLCWRTSYWTPAAAANDAAGCACDKDMMPKEKCEPPVAKPVAAATAATAPAPKKCDFTATLKDDQTFAFGKATLTPAALAQLDKEVIAKLSTCAEVKLILVTGHTDRIGSQQANQKLSEKRADAVKAYLIKKGVKTEIDTMGAGKTQAVPGVSCNDKLPKKKLIDCLAPNRRTVVEVQGPAR
jgi:OOP family OmpA-OmpF porin